MTAGHVRPGFLRHFKMQPFELPTAICPAGNGFVGCTDTAPALARAVAVGATAPAIRSSMGVTSSSASGSAALLLAAESAGEPLTPNAEDLRFLPAAAISAKQKAKEQRSEHTIRSRKKISSKMR